MPLQYFVCVQKVKEKLAEIRGQKITDSRRLAEALDIALYLLEGSEKLKTRKEKKRGARLSRMMKDPAGKAFTVSMADQCFRSSSPSKAVNRCVGLLDVFGIPKYLDFFTRLQLSLFRKIGPAFPSIALPLLIWGLRKESSAVIVLSEKRAFSKHIALRKKEGVRLNVNHLGEAILGEKEALARLETYVKDLESPDVEYISIKISTIFSQIHLIDRKKTLEILSDRLRRLYRAAKSHTFERANGEKVVKFVNLDMEEYKDLELTEQLFKQVLSDPEFITFSAGIVLQAYLPDCFLIQKELTEWAKERVGRGGAPIKIRIVKGANLAMEQVEAGTRGWPQAPYKTKAEVDANYKKMVSYGSEPANAKAVRIGIATHNIFDIAYALVARSENRTEESIEFEMLEGMADHTRKMVAEIAGGVLLYCPVASKKNFTGAIAYLIRRLDENTGPENFLRYSFGLRVGSSDWELQAKMFSDACNLASSVPVGPRRTQDRFEKSEPKDIRTPFSNEPDTDFSLKQNWEWAQEIAKSIEGKKIAPIPCMIGGKEVFFDSRGKGFDPSFPEVPFYEYSLADSESVNKAVEFAKTEESKWKNVSYEERARIIANTASKLRDCRGELIGCMMSDGGKTVLEADPEVSEAIDFAEYYLRSALSMKEGENIRFEGKGTVLVTSPWNFPVAIPAGGILAALAAGNCVIFKPAPEAVLTGWVLARIFWEAGVPKEVLQFINCADNPVGSTLIADTRIDAVILTGATQTARLFMKIRNDLNLFAETGGKNALIVTALSDRDAAIKDLVHSAFGHSGQKCSAASLAVLEAEVYDDPNFLAQLKDAVESLCVGSPRNLSAKITPLIRPAGEALLRGLTKLEPGEKWLVEPKQDKNNPNLWSPGVKLGVKKGSFMHTTELFGPVLAVMRAKDLDEAIEIANGTPYGLTAGIHSLDKKEIKKWILKIEAGNLYVNRSTTGAIVRRQPFGGCKGSSFGFGSKAGGPSYVMQFMNIEEIGLPSDRVAPPLSVNRLIDLCGRASFTADDLGLWYGSVCSYAFWAKHLQSGYDPDSPKGLSDLVVGQDNALFYRPRSRFVFRVQKEDAPFDVLRVLAAALCVNASFEVSLGGAPVDFDSNGMEEFPNFTFTQENEESFIRRVGAGAFERVRLIEEPKAELMQAAAAAGCFLSVGKPFASGRFELLQYVREVAVSYDYHRYGNLGIRENEKRNPVL